jgi:hypothetical protein
VAGDRIPACRGFPANFQTLTGGVERGKDYFFQSPAGQTIAEN